MKQALYEFRRRLPAMRSKLRPFPFDESASAHHPSPIPIQPYKQSALPINKSESIAPFEFISCPSAFYDRIRKMIQHSRHQIILSALYFGDGGLEQAILADIESSLSQYADLKVTMIFDHSRSTRPKHGSIDVLTSLAQKYFPRFHAHFYQMPTSRSKLSQSIASPLREGLGVYHAKFCIFDEEIILTGANLSKEYFTARIDRYLVTKETSTRNYLEDFTRLVSQHSHYLNASGIIMPPKFINDDDLKAQLLALATYHPTQDIYEKTDHSFHPVIQHKSIGIDQEHEHISDLLSSLSRYIKQIVICSPYPSFPNSLVKAISSSAGTKTMLTASMKSHGFANAKGLKVLIPQLHNYFMDQILLDTSQSTSPAKIKVLLFNKLGWTFHAKGFWTSLDDGADQNAIIAYIGSSNFGERSWSRDFELGFLLISECKDILRVIEDEARQLTERDVVEVKHTETQNNKSLIYQLGMPILAYFFRSYL
jgi:CDP-diacylglycerol---glycerol-3-phosphate 3-phosphatidyltransferase